MKIVIEKGIPIPSAKRGVDKFRLNELEVGDSFFLELTQYKEKQIRNTLSLRARRLGIKPSIRRVDDGIRVWRVE